MALSEQTLVLQLSSPRIALAAAESAFIVGSEIRIDGGMSQL